MTASGSIESRAVVAGNVWLQAVVELVQRPTSGAQLPFTLRNP